MKKIAQHVSQLNKIFDNRTRLGIMSILMVNDWVEFKVIKQMLALSDGNMASHIKALEREAVIDIKKEFVGKKPQTSYRVNEAGRKAFNDHLDALEALIRQREQ